MQVPDEDPEVKRASTQAIPFLVLYKRRLPGAVSTEFDFALAFHVRIGEVHPGGWQSAYLFQIGYILFVASLGAHPVQ